MTEKKMTISDLYDSVLAFLADNGADESLMTFINDRKEMHVKKNGNRKPTKTQTANAALMDDIIAYLRTCGTRKSISELIKDVPSCHGLSTPKVSALVTKLKNEDKVVRTEEKGKVYFSIA